ncbi:putative glycerophosphodiester phosphodiesterase YhdW [Paramacrobiotus metropolitanus]|uniref:putative glycerophosphodiester phosphodiesterase YhdW n=1 Tax=Paramacrobiotus metropolitanus TaxID=2943436 RepID=UPI002445BB39|nr:putative glycerophosphodiester phosphodiesterase YhdW [Paramacrobiotus metropolitanus]
MKLSGNFHGHYGIQHNKQQSVVERQSRLKMLSARVLGFLLASGVLAAIAEGNTRSFKEDTVQPLKKPATCFRCIKTLSSFDKQGHRGCRGLLPENTIAAMLHALDLGVTTLELDTVITNDGHVIVSHEPFFNHEITTKPDGSFVRPAEERSLNIYRMNYTTTQQYDVGARGNPRFPRQTPQPATKPLLRDLISSVEEYVKVNNNRTLPLYNIETKSLASTDDLFHPPPAAFVEALVGVVSAGNILERLTIQSFDFRTLRYLHDKYPAIRTAALIEEGSRGNLTTYLDSLGFVPTTYSPHYSLVTRDLIDAVHALGMKILPWTVNSAVTINRLMDDGVDGIITDYPDLFQ